MPRVSEDILLLIRASAEVLEAVTACVSILIFCHFLNNLVKYCRDIRILPDRQAIHVGAHIAWPLVPVTES